MPGAGKFEKGAVAWVSSIDPAAGKEGFRIAIEVCVQEGQVRRVRFRLQNGDTVDIDGRPYSMCFKLDFTAGTSTKHSIYLGRAPPSPPPPRSRNRTLCRSRNSFTKELTIGRNPVGTSGLRGGVIIYAIYVGTL